MFEDNFNIVNFMDGFVTFSQSIPNTEHDSERNERDSMNGKGRGVDRRRPATMPMWLIAYNDQFKMGVWRWKALRLV